MEGSRPAGSSGRFHHIIWLGDPRRANLSKHLLCGPPGPPLLMNVISCCRCCAEGKACKETNCSCHRVKLSCTMYCLCTAGDACHNPFTKKEDEMEDAAPNNYDHEHENDRDEQDEEEDDQLAD